MWTPHYIGFTLVSELFCAQKSAFKSLGQELPENLIEMLINILRKIYLGLIIVAFVHTKDISYEFLVFRFGTERLYAQKEDLLHEVLELEAEKNLLSSGESKYQDEELRKRALEGLSSPEPDKSSVMSVTTAPPAGMELLDQK